MVILLCGMCRDARSQVTVSASAIKQASGGRARRDFEFTYVAQVQGLTKGTTAHLWLPIPPSSDDQIVEIRSMEFRGKGAFTKEPKYGNEVLRIDAKPDDEGKLQASVGLLVTRFAAMASSESPAATPDEVLSFLKADLNVPVAGKPLQLLQGLTLPEGRTDVGRALYNVVYDHMTYSKRGTGWGQGSAIWACEKGYGNCSDFHSLFISLARSQQIPAKFEIGFSLPAKRGRGQIDGYHCWAKFLNEDQKWVPVDISDAKKQEQEQPQLKEFCFGNLTENRVTLTVGRDLTFSEQKGPPLNFFVYPYLEVDDDIHSVATISTKVEYADVKQRSN